MTQFRFHRGQLEESMKTIVEVKDIEHLKELISKQYKLNCVHVETEYYCYDARVSWETYIVRAIFAAGPSLKKQEGFPVGFTDGELKKTDASGRGRLSE